MSDYLLDEARSRFGTSVLYPYQRLVAGTILDACNGSEEHARNLVAVLPTGGGKSLCFQLPAAILDAPTLIVYPLLSLISDQERRMRAAGLSVAVFRAGQTGAEREAIVQECRRQELDAVLASPEVLDSSFGRTAVQRCGFGLAVVDEAHCVTEWGQSFRESYMALGEHLESVPVVAAFTATASESTLISLNEILFLGHKAHRIVANPDRPELRYTVIPVSSVLRSLEHGFQTASVCPRPDYAHVHKPRDAFQLPAIVFCRTRSETERIARHLYAHTGIKDIRYYHAGLPVSQRAATEQWFFNAERAVLCATCAYGMGVDKKDVRTVIHTRPPATIEAYVQEAGRAGRDKQAASAVLLLPVRSREGAFAGQDDPRLQNLIDGNSCRRESILNAFGARSEGCAGCDVCAGYLQTEAECTAEIRALHSVYGSEMAVKIARGDFMRYPELACLPGFGSLSGWTTMHLSEAFSVKT